MAVENPRERIRGVVSELRGLAPLYAAAIRRCDVELEALNGDAPPQDRNEDARFWALTAFRNALIRLRLIIENNFNALETLALLATTRYIFEALVWMRLILEREENSLVFYGRVVSGQLEHFQALKDKLESECALFDELQVDEATSHEEFLMSVQGGNKPLEPRRAAAAMTALMENVDRKAWRAFSLYAEEAKQNGFGFQAHLIRTQAIPKVAAQIAELEDTRAKLLEQCSSFVKKELKNYWKWKAKATQVGMLSQYDFIYSFTSRLLHASPSSMYTDCKNLEDAEYLMFLDYVHVSLLDVLDVVGQKFGSSEVAH